MKIYQVGGSVRDEIRGVKPHDIDYCVVGSSIPEMLTLGYKQVGKDFPVFLHPDTKEEYALARKEKKTGDTHRDFVFAFDPSITLEEDLERRDFTINSIAKDMETNTYIDPFNGIQDIQNKIIRVTSKVHFSEDPLRILRAFRFKVLTGYTIEADTDKILREMIKNKELNNLSKERIYEEFTKGLLINAGQYIEVLHEYGALKEIVPELELLFDIPEKLKYHSTGNTWLHTKAALNSLSKITDNITIDLILAVLFHDIYKGVVQKYNHNRKKGEIYLSHDGKEAVLYFEKIADRLGFSNITKHLCSKVIVNHMRIWSGFGTGVKIKTWYKCLNSISYKFTKDATIKTDIIINACVADHISDHIGVNPLDSAILKKIIVESLNTCNSIKYENINGFDTAIGEKRGELIEAERMKQLAIHIKPLFELLKKGKKNELIKILYI